MAAKKQKFDQKMLVRIGALVIAALLLLGSVFGTVISQIGAHSHTYTPEELAALQAVLEATGEDHTGHDHSVEELESMLDEAGETEEDHTGHDHE